MSDAPIIIKKIKKVEGHGHHGGAWKVAYADFVTAMMAFFLLMWLLNATSEEQKRGISNYFGPYGNAQGAGGSGGILGGLSVQSKGMWTDNKTSPTVVSPSVKVEMTEEAGYGDEVGGELEEDGYHEEKRDEVMAVKKEGEIEEDATSLSEKGLKDALEKTEAKEFKQAEEALKQAIETIPDLKELAKNLIIDNTPEGLRIQIIDHKGLSMFPIGSSKMHEYMKKLLQQIAKITMNLPNKLSISGHTDSNPYANTKSYSNWELSSDRANASRRILLDAGLASERIYSVVGKAHTEPLIKSDPKSERNRRISIVLRKQRLDSDKGGIEDRKGEAPTRAVQSAPKSAPSEQIAKTSPEIEKPQQSVSIKLGQGQTSSPVALKKDEIPNKDKIIASVDAMLERQSRP